jgi:hypothetical protein
MEKFKPPSEEFKKAEEIMTPLNRMSVILSILTFLPLIAFAALIGFLRLVDLNLLGAAILGMYFLFLVYYYPALLIFLLITYFKKKKIDIAASRPIFWLVFFVSALIILFLAFSLFAGGDRFNNENEKLYFMITIKSQLLPQNSTSWNLCGKISPRATFGRDREKLRAKCFSEAAIIFKDKSLCQQIENSRFTLAKSVTRQQCIENYDKGNRIDPNMDEEYFELSLSPIFEDLGYRENYFDFFEKNDDPRTYSADRELPWKYLIKLMQQKDFINKVQNLPDFSQEKWSTKGSSSSYFRSF